MTFPPSTPPPPANNNDGRGDDHPKDCPWHPGLHSKHSCTLNPDGPNFQIPPGTETTTSSKTRVPSITNPCPPTHNNPNNKAVPTSGIPTGTGTPTSSLKAHHNPYSMQDQLNKQGRGYAAGRGGRGSGDQGNSVTKMHPHNLLMSTKAGKATAILLGRSNPAFPISFQSLAYSNLTEYEQAYIKVSLVASRIYHHSNKKINAHFAGHLWYNLSTKDLILMMSNMDHAITNFTTAPGYPFFPPPNKMHLCPRTSSFVTSTIPKVHSNNEEEQKADAYKRIEIFLQRFMGNHWSHFMSKLVETNPAITELQNLVNTKGALFMKADISKITYDFTIPTTRIHPDPKPYNKQSSSKKKPTTHNERSTTPPPTI